MGTIESQGSVVCAGMWAPTRPCVTGASPSMKRPGRTPDMRQKRANASMAASDARSVSCALAARRVRGRPRNVTPKALTKLGSCKRGGQRQHGADGGNEELETPRRQGRAQKDGLKGEPLGNETVEGG